MLEKLLLILNDICGELHALNTKLEGAVFEGVTAVSAPVVAAVEAVAAKVEAVAAAVSEPQQTFAPPTREELGKALIALATEKGRDAAVAALASVGNASALKDVTEKDYPTLAAVIAKARQ